MDNQILCDIIGYGMIILWIGWCFWGEIRDVFDRVLQWVKK